MRLRITKLLASASFLAIFPLIGALSNFSALRLHTSHPTSLHWKSSPCQFHRHKRAGAVRLERCVCIHSQVSDDGNESIDDIKYPWSKPALAILDAASLLFFAAIGRASHSEDGSTNTLMVAQVAAPFMASWFLTSPLTKVYDTTEGPVDSLKQTAKGWIIAIPLGCGLRGIIKGYVPPVPFVIVTMISTLVILGSTRALYSVAEKKISE